jgi:glycosyltransferase involved in cell wall biosynthesis
MNFSKKKILIFHPALAPYRIDLFNSINENFEAEFYFFNRNLLNQKFDQENLQKLIGFECKYLDRGFNLRNRSFRFGLRKIIKECQPDIVICPEYNLVNLVAIVHRFFSKRKYKIITICDDNVKIAKSIPLIKKLIRNFFLKHLDYVILTHQDIIDWYKSNLSPKSELLLFPIIRNEVLFFKQLRSSIPISEEYRSKYDLENKKVLLFVGRLVEVKNTQRLLESFALMLNSVDDTVLVLVGSGELEATLLQEIGNLNISKFVIMPGRFEGNDLLAWYLIGDVFILPSISETFGAVINEALLSGCYVLASREAGGASLIEENINGNIFDPYSVTELSNILIQTFQKGELFKRHVDLKENKMLISFQCHVDALVEKINE